MNKDNSGVLVGRNAVKELLRSGRDIDKILIAKGAGHGTADIVKTAKERRIVVSQVPTSRLDELADGIPHQGVAAYPAEADYATIDDIFALAEERGEPPLIVIADEISDPHNLGAIIRCAEGAGAHGIIIPKRRSSGLTQIVAKSSAGALSWLPVVRATNLAREIDELKKRGVWVWAAEAGGSPYYENDMSGACAIILGSEGQGISRLLKEKSDFMISIPMYGHVTSFNVATASAVILCEAARQRHGGVVCQGKETAK